MLTASFVLTCSDVARLALCAGVAVAHAVEDHLPGLRLLVKWPNDVVAHDRKLAGILCEAVGGRVVVGIGLNVAPQWTLAGRERARGALGLPIALADLGAAPAFTALLPALRRYLMEAAALLAAGGWPQLREQVRARDWLRGRPVTASGRRGTAAGIDDDGRLLLADADGGQHAIVAGSVEPA